MTENYIVIPIDFSGCINEQSGPGSSVGIVTDYGLEGPGFESWWG